MTADDKQYIIDLYESGKPVKDIAVLLGYSIGDTSRIISIHNDRINDERIARLKAIRRKPEVGTPVLCDDGKTRYDYTDLFIDRPCIYSGGTSIG